MLVEQSNMFTLATLTVYKHRKEGLCILEKGVNFTLEMLKRIFLTSNAKKPIKQYAKKVSQLYGCFK